ncbi:hotdog fold domain-containing protein [Marinobacter nanhaiticus D15-8W]|uniref:DUF4442 domain-containing protein n=1 Tax=Marinobacter nanhaiticus D15-8W TaxID=626887 RepID=N6VZ24_9GAMM|nr:DUF4442 domain-containing protein [Marinobacter nanhaiticus]ENO13124.1 DUF4442 domain-containing protein [Marinobacter nanhaiticus D15-8W]BES70481.1 hotdog fold domain-containing protein [Marinobacter nanhaiticus D15-8W]
MTRTIRKLFASARGLQRALNVFGPYLGAGITVRHLAPDFSEAIVEMKLHWYNTNYVGTHFGGSLYSMTDPMYMLLLMNRLGNEYIVWDKAASIDFLKPGKGKVTAHFVLSDEVVENIKTQTANGDKVLPEWAVDVLDESGEIVARVHKTLYVRRKRPS